MGRVVLAARALSHDERITIFSARRSRRSSVIALTEEPLLDAHDYSGRDYVESVFDGSVDYANARRRRIVASGRCASVDARRVENAFRRGVCVVERDFR